MREGGRHSWHGQCHEQAQLRATRTIYAGQSKVALQHRHKASSGAIPSDEYRGTLSVLIGLAIEVIWATGKAGNGKRETGTGNGNGKIRIVLGGVRSSLPGRFAGRKT